MFLSQYLLHASMDFHQTFVSSFSWDKDELIRFWDQKVKGQGHVCPKLCLHIYYKFVHEVQ